MRRSGHSRGPHKDPVSESTRKYVMTRDQLRMIVSGIPLREIRVVCVAPLLDPSQSGKCWGRSTLDHVKSEPRMSKRAPSDDRHLVTLCEGHTENGAKAGYQWNTANRPLLREYLASEILHAE